MSSPPDLPKFVVWAPDYTDEGVLQRRQALRPSHREKALKLISQGILRVAGGCTTLESIHATAEDKKFVGSCLIFEGENIDVVRKLVEEDMFYKGDVVCVLAAMMDIDTVTLTGSVQWDKEKLVILPIALATSLPPVPS
ncbi:hypothetical protein DEU56DRAFT_960936 [Suillus clintonianus]|uniref:uncharacterized protein n=1 Tax=Suillus clintonianus TaxID=1904413 RepID=UPI001B86B493|nr:uncharacterized protein DEU56DRAFT_960936 [Suillus clintonianus]KAG2125956.1 hypothetical protein DEU56DRAFT_960936 [Suillus clintonianus]